MLDLFGHVSIAFAFRRLDCFRKLRDRHSLLASRLLENRLGQIRRPFYLRFGSGIFRLPWGCRSLAVLHYFESRQHSRFGPKFVVVPVRRVVHKGLVGTINLETESPEDYRPDSSFPGDDNASFWTNEAASTNIYRPV